MEHVSSCMDVIMWPTASLLSLYQLGKLQQ